MLVEMAIRNWIGNLKSLHSGRWQWDYFRSMSTLLPNTALPSDDRSNPTANLTSQGALTHANSAKVKFLGVFIGFVDDSKRKRQYAKALEKRRRVIHRLRQLQKQRQESWEKQVERLAFNAFTRAYRKTLNTSDQVLCPSLSPSLRVWPVGIPFPWLPAVLSGFHY